MKTAIRTLSICLLFVVPPAFAQAKTQCFQWKTKTAGSSIQLELPSGNGPVSGIEYGVVEDDEQGYYTSWESRITGERVGDRLNVRLETKIEDDVQTEDKVWRIEGGSIVTDREQYGPVDCNSIE